MHEIAAPEQAFSSSYISATYERGHFSGSFAILPVGRAAASKIPLHRAVRSWVGARAWSNTSKVRAASRKSRCIMCTYADITPLSALRLGIGNGVVSGIPQGTAKHKGGVL